MPNTKPTRPPKPGLALDVADIHEWDAVMAFRRGDRTPLARLLKARESGQPLSGELNNIFVTLVDGKTGRRRGRPAAGDIPDMLLVAYRVGVHIRDGLLVKEAIEKVHKEQQRPVSYVEKAHQKYRRHTALFFDS